MDRGWTDPARITSFSVAIPFLGEIEWEPNRTERNAAWALYVELVTRVSLQSLDLDEGGLREALRSLYALFEAVRNILRDAGPDVGIGRGTVGGTAIAVLNKGVRPFLTKWHRALLEYEAQRPPSVPPHEWERAWAEEVQLRGELQMLSESLWEYADALARIAGVQR